MALGFPYTNLYTGGSEVDEWSLTMSEAYPFLILEQPCNEAIAWITRQMSEEGLQVLRTFDLKAARPDPADCPCPHHGTDQCDCQMVVLLVYADGCQPISLVAHSHEGNTWFS